MKKRYSKLLGRIREFGYTQKSLAKAMGINPCTLSLKLKGKAVFTVAEIDILCKLLDIAKEDIGSYFFAD